MRSFARLLVAATLVAAMLATSVHAACDVSNCRSCILGKCVYCNDGYYLTDGTCAPCQSEHCTRCQIAGRCLACEAGYSISYIDASDGITISSYGKCAANGSTAEKCGDNCKSCLAGRCLVCNDGYYVSDGTCTSCKAAHCTQCQIAGRCLACDAGYSIAYIQTTNQSTVIDLWGTCAVNGASFASAGVAVAGFAAMLLYIL